MAKADISLIIQPLSKDSSNKTKDGGNRTKDRGNETKDSGETKIPNRT